jgi:hypothetical protein
MPLIDKDEAFALLAGWRDRGTLLRVRAELFPAIFDLEGTIEKAESPVITLVVEDRGTATVLLKDGWNFATGEPQSQSGNVQGAIGSSSSNKKRYEFGKSIVATKRDGSRHCVMFIEILGQIIDL